MKAKDINFLFLEIKFISREELIKRGIVYFHKVKKEEVINLLYCKPF